MKTFIILVSIFATVLSASLHSDLQTGLSSIKFHFFSNDRPKSGTKLALGKSEVLKNTPFSAKKDSLFLVHGWKADNTSDFNVDITTTILSLLNINVFVLDWRDLASESYSTSKDSVVKVGVHLADFVRELQHNFKLELSRVKFVGWSLGAHICGNAGASLGGQVDRIVGLDPAGPSFSFDNRDERLDETDAKYVQVIHTSHVLGFQKQSGHADFYPNGGKNQPGCGTDLLGGCSHGRVFSLYVESLYSDKFVASKCGSWSDYTKDRCKNNEKVVMGGFVPDYNARGNYYLATNGESPYARG